MFVPSHESVRRNGFARHNDQKKDGQADVEKQWADYVKCANEAIQKGKDFYHPLGVAFNASATTKRSAFQSCQDKWGVFEKAVNDYNTKFAAGAPVQATKFTLSTTSLTQVAPAEFVDTSGGSAPMAPASSDVSATLSQLPPPSAGMGTGTMIAIGAAVLLVGGVGLWFALGSGED